MAALYSSGCPHTGPILTAVKASSGYVGKIISFTKFKIFFNGLIWGVLICPKHVPMTGSNNQKGNLRCRQKMSAGPEDL